MTILELIQKACKSKGVPEKYAERIQKTFKIEKAEGMEAYVDLFKENILPAIQEAEEGSKKTTEEAIEEYEKKHNLKDGKPIETPPANPPVDLTKLSPEVRAIIEGQQKQLEALTELVSGVTKNQSDSQKLVTVLEKMKGKVSDKHLDRIAKRVNLDAKDLDAEIESQIAEYTEMKQSFLDEATSNGDYVPASGGGANDSDFNSFLKSKSEEKGSDFATKEL